MPTQNYRQSRRRFRRRPVRRMGSRAVRSTKLVTGRSPYTKAARYLAAGASTYSTVRQLVSDVGTVMSMVNSESKYLDTSSTAYDPAISTTAPICLTLIAEGSGEHQRNGRSILGKDLTLRFVCNMVNSDTFTLRVIVFCSKYIGTTLPTLANLLEDPTNVLSPINKDNGEQFVIMKSNVYNINPVNQAINGKMYMKIPWHLKYDGTAADVTSLDNNPIHVLFLADSGVGDLVLNYYARFNFYDN